MQWQFLISWTADGSIEASKTIYEQYIAEDASHVVEQWEDMRHSCKESMEHSQVIAIQKLEVA